MRSLGDQQTIRQLNKQRAAFQPSEGIELHGRGEIAEPIAVPANIAEEVAFDAAGQDLFETFVIERVRAGQSIFGLYPPDAENKKAFEAWKAKRK